MWCERAMGALDEIESAMGLGMLGLLAGFAVGASILGLPSCRHDPPPVLSDDPPPCRPGCERLRHQDMLCGYPDGAVCCPAGDVPDGLECRESGYEGLWCCEVNP